MSDRILVTGGAGFIGSHLVDALVERGHHVRVLDNLEPQVHGNGGRPPGYLNRGAEYVWADVRDRAALHRALDGVQVIFHEAAMVGVGQSMYQIERYVAVNSLGTAILLDLLANEPHQVRKVVVASSMSVYGEGAYECARHGSIAPPPRSAAQLASRDWELHCPHCGEPAHPLPTREQKPPATTSIYAIAKKNQEEMCLCIGNAHGIPTVALRYFNTYGPRQSLSNPYTGVAAIFASRLLNGSAPLIFEDGRQTRDFVHVSDIVRANLLAMEREEANGWAINIGSGSPVSICDVAGEVGRALGTPIGPEVTAKFRAGDIRHCVADITLARTVLGFAPRVSLTDGMRDLAQWLRGQRADDHFAAAARELERRGLTR